MRDLEQCLGEDHNKIAAWIANGGFVIGFKARGGITGMVTISIGCERKTFCDSSGTILRKSILEKQLLRALKEWRDRQRLFRGRRGPGPNLTLLHRVAVC
jgi:hypothetical protein